MLKHTIVATLIGAATLSAWAQSAPTADEEKAMKSLAAPKDSTKWSTGTTIGFNNTFTYLSQWAAGGNNSISTTGLLSTYKNYRNGKNAWDNSLDMAYGILLQGLDSRAIKTDDKLDVTSKYGRQASKKWFYAALLNFKTQFAPGYSPLANGIPDYNRKISDLMAPGWTLFSLGMDYKPNDKLTAFISPVTYRGIFVLDQDLADAGAFGVKRQFETDGITVIKGSGENLRSEMGAYARVQYTTDVIENVNLKSKIELFSNYIDNPQNVDISWENLISMKINKWMTTTIFTHLIYDDNTQIVKETDELTGAATNVGPGVQFKSIIGIGLSWKL
ncbi:MAG: DUF3078 domain-containing protein [Flavobacteriales bacterium]|jgi:hypothetical protein